MKRSATAVSKAWGSAPRRTLRLAVTLVTLLAFIFQTFVTQTHIHNAAGAVAAPLAQAAAHTAGPSQQPDKFPPGDDPANCPICQELLHAGAVITPAAAILLISTVATTIDVVGTEMPAIKPATSHGWKSRAPPLA